VTEEVIDRIVAGSTQALVVWATGAKPRLEIVLHEARVIHDAADQALQPVRTREMTSGMIAAVAIYLAAAEAYIDGDTSGGTQLIGDAHRAWRAWQTRYGLARY
jgi:hypothetical protein